MASIRKLNKLDPASPWICEYTNPLTGKRVRYTPKTGLKKDADAARRRIEAEIERGAHTVASETVTFKVAAKAWLEECERRKRIGDRMAGSTFRRYCDWADHHVIPAVGHMKLSDLKHAQLQEFINEKAKLHASSSLSSMALVVLQTLRLAVDRQWLAASPLANRPLRIPRGRKEKAIPSREEIDLILKAIAVRAKDEHRTPFRNRMIMTLLAVFAGLRRGEICGLQWENVDFATETIHVRHSLSKYDGLKGPKSQAGRRSVPMAPPVAAVLRQYRADLGSSAKGYVLVNEAARFMSGEDTQQLWVGVLKKAGLLKEGGAPKYTFHSLRHTNVSLLIALGLQPFHIQRLIGHSSIKMTMDVYGHMFPDDSSSREAITAAAGQFAAVLALPGHGPQQLAIQDAT